MVNKDIIVQKSSLPFKCNFETLHLENCKTLQEIVDKTIPFNFTNARLVVTVNNEIIDSTLWQNYNLKKGDIVGLNFIPTGGGDGKNPLATIITVVASIAAFYTGGLSMTALQAGSYLASAGWAAATVGISMIASLAIGSLLSTPRQTSTESESQSKFIEGASNSINKYGVVPINLGTNRMFPPQAALPYTETSGNNQYARQIFTYGYGNVVLSERKIGETSIDDYAEIEINDRLNSDLNQGVQLYANDVYQESLNIKLTQEEEYYTRSTQRDADECELDFTFQGLVYLNGSGGKDVTSVQFEIQYAEKDTDNWSTPANGKVVEKEQVFQREIEGMYTGNRGLEWPIRILYFLCLNVESGEVNHFEVKTDDDQFHKPYLSSNWVILGYVVPGMNNYVEYRDLRSEIVGQYIPSLEDFNVTMTVENGSFTLNVTGGTILGTEVGIFEVRDATTQVLRVTKRIVFPKRGQYDIRIKRLTADSEDDKLLNACYLTALKSITYQNPVNFADISGTAVRIKATDQLNGTISSYNCIVTSLIKRYNAETDTWDENVPSSNPADIFRYVLQSPAFAKHEEITDDRIDLEKLKEWSIYCDSLKLTYNKIIDYETSIDDVLNDVCAAGVATLSKVNNIYSVIIDNERPIIKGLVTPRNSWDYSGNINYPEIPHALRVEFRNSEVGYETDERIVYADGYDEKTATLYERLQFDSCTNADLAYWYGRRYFATALLQPETHTFKMDFEHLTFDRGDRISLINDVILVGVGQGRITSLITDESGNVTGFTVDDIINIPEVNNLGVRIRDNAGKGMVYYYYLENVSGENTTFTFRTALAPENAPALGSLCAFVEDGKELDLIVTQIKPGSNESATITAIDYAPERFKPLEEIPPFESNITIAPDFYKPYAPELAGDIQTDESVMIRNSDGSLSSVMVIPLLNRNESNVVPIVQVKRTGVTEWYNPTALKKDPNQLILTGLQDGINYDIQIRYQRQTGLQLLSDVLTIKNVEFIGGSNPPKKVQNFRLTVTNGMALFEWVPNDDIDISHYVIKYSASTEDVTWEGAQVVMDKITSTSITNIIHKGMYLIKAVDMLGNESEEPTVIISKETGVFNNIVEELIQEPDWLGVKENVIASKGVLSLAAGKTIGYYYFNPDVVDLGEIYECSLTANLKAVIRKRDRIRDILAIRDVKAIRDIGADLNTNGNWRVDLEMSLSNDGVVWSDWQTFVAAKQQFRACKFRIKLYTDNEYITPTVSIAQINIDMPDRYETGEDIQITDANAGIVIKYENAFRNNPAVNITLQDAAIDDKIEYINKNSEGFTIKVFNGTLNSYVTRSFDYLAAGYGKALKE